MKWFKDKKDKSDGVLHEMVAKNEMIKFQQRYEKMN